MRQILYIHLVYDNIYIHYFFREKFSYIKYSFDSSFIWTRCSSKIIMEFWSMSMNRKSHLIQSCIKYFLTKIDTRKHISIGHCLNMIISDFSCKSDIFRKLWMNTRLSSWDDDTIFYSNFETISNLLTNQCILNESSVLCIWIQTKNTLHIACCYNTYPDTVFTSCFLLVEEIILHSYTFLRIRDILFVISNWFESTYSSTRRNISRKESRSWLRFIHHIGTPSI